MFSVRLVTVDSYQAQPLPQLDPTFSEFRGSEIKHVPVIRVFGITPNGEKTCLHIHGIFPYLFVPYTGEEDAGILAYRLAASLDTAINVSLGSATSNTQHVYSIQRVSGTPFYGYHRKEHQFLKIYFYNPAMVKRAADLLQNGSVLHQGLQPHESHISYILQFMMDYNIYGMSLIKLRCVKHRRMTQTLAELASSGQSVNSENNDIIYLPARIERQSTCEIEIDALGSDITNRLEIQKNLDLNPGLAAIWDEERARRAQAGLEGGNSQLVNPKSPPRPTFNPTDNDIYQEQRLARRLLTISQCDESTLSTMPNRSVAYAAEVQDGENLLNSSHVGNISVQTNEKIPLTRDNSLGSFLDSSAIVASQNSEDSSILGTDDMPLVDLLDQLARESDENLKSVDTDSVLGSQLSVLANDEKSENEDEDVADLNLTCLQLDSLSSLEMAVTPVEQAVETKNTSNDKHESCTMNVSSFLSPWETSLSSSKSINDDDDDDDADNNKRKGTRNCRLPQYDGAGDVSPTLLNSDNEDVQENRTSAKDFSHLPECNGTCEIITESRNSDNREKIMKITSRTSNSSLMNNITSDITIGHTGKNENFQNSHEERLSHEDTPLSITNENYLVNDATMGYSHFDRILEIGTDFVPDLEVMHTSMEIGILMSSEDSDKAESIDDNQDNEIPIETVLNGDPCFTESAELDKSDLTELHDQYVSLFGNVPLPDIHKSPRTESDLPGNSSSGNFVENDFTPKTHEITENTHLPRESIVRPDSSSSSENVEPNIQEPEIRGTTLNKLNDAIEPANCKEIGNTTNDNSDHNCNVVVATWAELQNLQIVEKSKISARPSRTRNERGKFPAAPRSMKRRGGIRLVNNEKVPSQVLRNNMNKISFQGSNSCPSLPSKIVQNSGKTPIKRLSSSTIMMDKSIPIIKTTSSEVMTKNAGLKLSSGTLANISRLTDSSFDDENEREFTPLRTEASLDAFHRSIIGSENPLVKNGLSNDKYSSYPSKHNENIVELPDSDGIFENIAKNCIENVDENLKNRLAIPDDSSKTEENSVCGVSHYSSQRSHNGGTIDIKEHRHCYLSRCNTILEHDVCTSDQVWIIEKRKRGKQSFGINRPSVCTSKKCRFPVVRLSKIKPKSIEEIVASPKNSEESANEDVPVKTCVEDNHEVVENSSSRISQTSMENDELPKQSKSPIERKSRSRRRRKVPIIQNNEDDNDNSSINDCVSEPNDPVSRDWAKKEGRWAKQFIHNADHNSRDRYNTRKHSSIVEYVKKRRRCAKKLNASEETTINRKKPRARTRYKEDNLPGIPGIVISDLPKKRRRTRNIVFSCHNRNTSDSTRIDELKKPKKIQPSKLFPNWGAKCEMPKSLIHDTKDKETSSNNLIIENQNNIASSPERSGMPKPRLAISPIPKRNISPSGKTKNSSPKYRNFSSTPKKIVEMRRKNAESILASQKNLSESVTLSLMMQESKSHSTRAKLRFILEKRLSQKSKTSDKIETKLSESTEKPKEDKIVTPAVTTNQVEETKEPRIDDEIKSIEKNTIENIEQIDKTAPDTSETIVEKNGDEAISLDPTTEICNSREFDDSTLSAEFCSSVDGETSDIFEAEPTENSVIAETANVEELSIETKQLVYDTDRYENAIKEANFFAGKDYTIDAVSLEIPTCLFEEDSNSVDKRIPKKPTDNNSENFEDSCNTTEDSFSDMSMDPRDLDVYDVESLTPSSSLSALDESVDTTESLFEGSEADDHTITESTRNSDSTIKSQKQIPTIVMDGEDMLPENESSFEEASPAFEALSPSPHICSELGKSLEEEFTVHPTLKITENPEDCKQFSKNLSKTQNDNTLNTIENTSVGIDKCSIAPSAHLLFPIKSPLIDINKSFHESQVDSNFAEDSSKLDNDIKNLVSQVVTEFENELDLADEIENNVDSVSIIDIEIQLDSSIETVKNISPIFGDNKLLVDAAKKNHVSKTVEHQEKISVNVQKKSELHISSEKEKKISESMPMVMKSFMTVQKDNKFPETREKVSGLQNPSKEEKKPSESTQMEIPSSTIVEKNEKLPKSSEKVSDVQIDSEKKNEISASTQIKIDSLKILEKNEQLLESFEKALKLQILSEKEKDISEGPRIEMLSSTIVGNNEKLLESFEKALEQEIFSKREKEISESTGMEIKSLKIVEKNKKLLESPEQVTEMQISPEEEKETLKSTQMEMTSSVTVKEDKKFPDSHEKISELQISSGKEKELLASTQIEMESSTTIKKNETLSEIPEKETTLPTTDDNIIDSNIESRNNHSSMRTAEKGVQTIPEMREELTGSESFQKTAETQNEPFPTIEKDKEPTKTISEDKEEPRILKEDVEAATIEIEAQHNEPKADSISESSKTQKLELREETTETKVEGEEIEESNREIESAVTPKDDNRSENVENVALDINKNDFNNCNPDTEHCESNELDISDDSNITIINGNCLCHTPGKRVKCRPVSIQLVNIDLSQIRNFVPKNNFKRKIEERKSLQTNEQDNTIELLEKNITKCDKNCEKSRSMEKSISEIASNGDSAEIFENLAMTENRSSLQNNGDENSQKMSHIREQRVEHDFKLSEQETATGLSVDPEPTRNNSPLGEMESEITAETESSLNFEEKSSQESPKLLEISEDIPITKSPQLAQSPTAKSFLEENSGKKTDVATTPKLSLNFEEKSLVTNILHELVPAEKDRADENAAINSTSPKRKDHLEKRPEKVSQEVAVTENVSTEKAAPIFSSAKRKNSRINGVLTESKSSEPASERGTQTITDQITIDPQLAEFHPKITEKNIKTTNSTVNSEERPRVNGKLCQIFSVSKICENSHSKLTSNGDNEIISKNLQELTRIPLNGDGNESVLSTDASLSESECKEIISPLNFSLLARKFEPKISVEAEQSDESVSEESLLSEECPERNVEDNELLSSLLCFRDILQRQRSKVIVSSEVELSSLENSQNCVDVLHERELLTQKIAQENIELETCDIHRTSGRPQINYQTNVINYQTECNLSEESTDGNVLASEGFELSPKNITEESIEPKTCIIHNRKGRSGKSSEVLTSECESTSDETIHQSINEKKSEASEQLPQKITENNVEPKISVVPKRKGRRRKFPETQFERDSQESDLLPQGIIENTAESNIFIGPKRRGRSAKNSEEQCRLGILRERYSQGRKLVRCKVTDENVESKNSVVQKKRGEPQKVSEDDSQKLSQEEKAQPIIIEEKSQEPESAEENIESHVSVVSETRDSLRKVFNANSQPSSQGKEAQPIEEKKFQKSHSAEENIETEFSDKPTRKRRLQKISQTNTKKLSQQEETQPIQEKKHEEPESAEKNIEPVFSVVPNRRDCSKQKQETNNDNLTCYERSKNPQESQLLSHKITDDNIDLKSFVFPKRKARSQKISQQKKDPSINEEKPQELKSTEEIIDSEISILPKRRTRVRKTSGNYLKKLSQKEEAQPIEEKNSEDPKSAEEVIKSKISRVSVRKDRSGEKQETNDNNTLRTELSRNCEEREFTPQKIADGSVESKNFVVLKRRGRSRESSQDNSQKLLQKEEAEPVEKMKSENIISVKGNVDVETPAVRRRRKRSQQQQETNDDNSPQNQVSQNSHQRELAPGRKSKNVIELMKRVRVRKNSPNNSQKLSQESQTRSIEIKSQGSELVEESVEPEIPIECERRDLSRQHVEINDKNSSQYKASRNPQKRGFSPRKSPVDRKSIKRKNFGYVKRARVYKKFRQNSKNLPQEEESAGNTVEPNIVVLRKRRNRSQQHQETNDNSLQDKVSENSQERELVLHKIAKESVKSKNSKVFKRRGHAEKSFEDISQILLQEDEAQHTRKMKSKHLESAEGTIKPIIPIVPDRREYSEQNQGTNDEKSSREELSQNSEEHPLERKKIAEENVETKKSSHPWKTSEDNSQNLCQEEETQPIEERKPQELESAGQNVTPEISIVPNITDRSGQKQVANSDNSLLDPLSKNYRIPQLVLRKITGENIKVKTFAAPEKRDLCGQVPETNFQQLSEPQITTNSEKYEIAKTPTEVTSEVKSAETENTGRNNISKKLESLPQKVPVTNIEPNILSTPKKRVRFDEESIRRSTEYCQNNDSSLNEDFIEPLPKRPCGSSLANFHQTSPRVKNIVKTSDDELIDLTRNEDLESSDQESFNLANRLELLKRQEQKMSFIKRINGVSDRAKTAFYSSNCVSLDHSSSQVSKDKPGRLNGERNWDNLMESAKRLCNEQLSSDYDPQVAASVQQPKILLKRLSRDLLESHGIAYRPKTKMFVKIFKKSTIHEDEEFRLPAYDGAADLSSSDTEDEDPNVTIASDEKRVCIYGSTKKNTASKCDIIVTPKKRKLNIEDDEASSQSSKRRAFTTSSKEPPKTSYSSPSRTSMLKSPGRSLGNYSPLKIIVTSPKVRRDTLEPRVSIQLENSDDNAKASSSSSSCVTTPRRKNSRLHDNMLRGRFSIVKSTNHELGDKHVIATTMGSDGLGELDGIQSRGQTKHRTVGTIGYVSDCDEATRIQSSTTSLRDGKDARKKLVFLDKEDKLVETTNDTEASNLPVLSVIESKESSKLDMTIKQCTRISDNDDADEISRNPINPGVAMFYSEPGPSRLHADVESDNRGPYEITTEEESDDDDDVCNVTFTQYVNSQMNNKNPPSSLDSSVTNIELNKIITIMPKFQPPSRQRIIDTMETYGVPKFRNQEPFFSDPADVPKQKELAHKMLKVSSKSFKDLPPFVSSVEGVTGLARWRKMILNEFHPSLAKSKDHVVKLVLAGNERVVMTPLVEPPTPKQVRNWLTARKYLEEKKKKEEEEESKKKLKEKQNIEIQVQILHGHENEERLSNASDSSLIGPSPERTLVPKKFEKMQNLTLKMKLARQGLFKRAEDIAKDTNDSQKLCESSEETLTKHNVNNSEMNPSLLSVLDKSRLFRDQEASRHLGISCGQIEFLSDSTRSNVANENLQNAKALTRYQYLTIMCLEVHVTTRGDLLPDAQHDPIAALFYSVQNDVPPASTIKPLEHGVIVQADGEKSKNKMYYSNSSNVPWTISFANNEEALLNSLVNLITTVDPEILIGWELETLSWGYVFQRASRLGVNLSKRISRIPTTQCKWEAQTPDIETLAEVKLPGRIVLDIWRIMRHEAALLSYTFESVIHHVLNERISCPSFKILSDWWNLEKSRPSRWRVIEHYSIRVLGVFRILDQLDIIGRTSELARLFGIQFYEVFTRGSQFRVESVMLRLAKPLNYIAVSPSPQQRASMRAMEALPLIMEPESMFYSDPLIVLDFQSLYPSIIIAHNYCFSTCLGRIEHIGQPQPFEFGAYTLRVPKGTAMKLQGKVNYAPCGVAFVKPEIRLGILPRMLTEILETRFMVKKAMKDHKKDDKTLQRALHSRQMGLKFLANVTYGYTAANFSGRMPCIEVGDSVISKSKETLERAIKLVETTPKWGARVVYGDTDSLFILVPGKSKADAFVIGNEIADAVTASNPPPIKLKFEKVMYPAILQTKKRYCGYMYETPEQEKPTYLAKGIETVRRDGCPAVSKILEKTLKILFETKDVTLVKKYVTRQLDKVLRGKVSIQDLTFAKEFRGLKGYRARACVPALELTRRLMKKDPRAVPRNSERVRYVIVAGAPNQALIHCVRTPWEVINDPGLRPNAIYYVTRVIIPPLNRCLNLMGVDVNAWYREMPHRQILDNPVGQPSDKQKLTIFQYFGTIVCVACGQSSNKGICMECLATPADTLVIIHEKLRWLNRTNSHVTAICQSCVGQVDAADCASLDCPVLYRRAQARRELSQAIQLREIIECGNNLEF